MQLSIWLAPLIALVVGVIAALVNGMQLIVGKENKVSEFRQDWINDQRVDLAKAIAAAEAIRRTTEPDKLVERLSGFDEAHARIELRENPIKPEWTAVRAALDELRKEILSASPAEDRIAAHRLAILDASRPPLKDNWTTVKQGETWFSVFKIAYATMITILILIAAGWMLVSALDGRSKPPSALDDRAAPQEIAPAPGSALLNSTGNVKPVGR